MCQNTVELELSKMDLIQLNSIRFQMGSYNCVDKCSEGYEYSNGECVDINECRFEHICDPRAECTNLPGTYKCECEPGMKGDGKSCKRESYFRDFPLSMQTLGLNGKVTISRQKI